MTASPLNDPQYSPAPGRRMVACLVALTVGLGVSGFAAAPAGASWTCRADQLATKATVVTSRTSLASLVKALPIARQKAAQAVREAARAKSEATRLAALATKAPKNGPAAVAAKDAADMAQKTAAFSKAAQLTQSSLEKSITVARKVLAAAEKRAATAKPC